MKLHVKIQSIDETFQARDATELLKVIKQQAAARAPFLLRGVIKNMNDLTFAAEAVKRANQANGRSDPAPASAQAFVDWAVARGYATIEEP